MPKLLNIFCTETEKYFQSIHKQDLQQGRTIFNDLEDFKTGFNSAFDGESLKYYESDYPKSKLVTEMYQSSPKMTAIVFMSYISPGKVMIYTNYVVMEGIDVMKIYLRMAGYNDFTISKENLGYCEYHGRIDPADRVKIKNMFNDKNNIYGNKCKIIMLSPSATEGIQLLNIRQEHIMEPYWTEVRIQQVMGRGIRQCSHRDLPMSERVVNIYRYKVVKPAQLDPDDTVRITTDQHIEDQAKAKANLIESFLGAMKEVAIDCELFKEHNMMSQSYYCFQFPENAVMGKNIGPAYKEDMKDDVKYDSGLNAKNSHVERIRVIKINAVYLINNDFENPKYSKSSNYWYDKKTGIVYDYETHYPIGKINLIDGIPNKLDKDTYIMTIEVGIPNIGTTVNP